MLDTSITNIRKRIRVKLIWFFLYKVVVKEVAHLDSKSIVHRDLCAKHILIVCDGNTLSGSVQRWISAKEEGGLGLRSLKEINLVCCLKLIWRLVSTNKFLWTNWIKQHLICQGSFWAMHANQKGTSGSWMWRKLLKYKDVAKMFYRREVRSGNNTSFWHDSWSTLRDF